MKPRHPGYPDGIHSYSDLDSQKELKNAGLPDKQDQPLHPSYADVRYGTTCSRSEERTDKQIYEELNQEFLRTSGADTPPVRIAVHQGIVTLQGVVDSQQARILLQEKVASWPGIKGVFNQIEIRQK